MTRPWSRAGRVVLIRDITASDRERLPDWRDDAPPHDGSLAVAAMAVMAARRLPAGLHRRRAGGGMTAPDTSRDTVEAFLATTFVPGEIGGDRDRLAALLRALAALTALQAAARLAAKEVAP